MSGQGTIGLEIVEQCEGADAIVIPGKQTFSFDANLLFGFDRFYFNF